MWYKYLLEKNRIPDILIRAGIRNLLKKRLKEEKKESCETQQEHLMGLIDELKNSPIAVNTSLANLQHYEIPTEFYQYCLGKHLKYSSGYWNNGVTDIDKSESDMLALTSQRAELSNGQQVLELGCGWGSLSLYMAESFPLSTFLVVSNSGTQKKYIDEEIKKRGLNNLEVITADMNTFNIAKQFDRVLSVEMFEHMRNYELLLKKISSFLNPQGKLFVHIFTHKEFSYKFEVKDKNDWMSQYFFTGGIMPSDNLLLYFTNNFIVENHWRINGRHYGKTSEAWLKNMELHKREIIPIFEKTYGAENALKWWIYWRIFFMSCAELWNFKNGNEWMVSHYLFKNK
jgi:cyclopropane-fatty-acyl-phospholipid synthase